MEGKQSRQVSKKYKFLAVSFISLFITVTHQLTAILTLNTISHIFTNILLYFLIRYETN